jgi:hypothetical protein
LTRQHAPIGRLDHRPGRQQHDLARRAAFGVERECQCCVGRLHAATITTYWPNDNPDRRQIRHPLAWNYFKIERLFQLGQNWRIPMGTDADKEKALQDRQEAKEKGLQDRHEATDKKLQDRQEATDKKLQDREDDMAKKRDDA